MLKRLVQVCCQLFCEVATAASGELGGCLVCAAGIAPTECPFQALQQRISPASHGSTGQTEIRLQRSVGKQGVKGRGGLEGPRGGGNLVRSCAMRCNTLGSPSVSPSVILSPLPAAGDGCAEVVIARGAQEYAPCPTAARWVYQDGGCCGGIQLFGGAGPQSFEM